jgi:hypothetical protein
MSNAHLIRSFSMKSMCLMLALFLLTLVAPRTTSAQTSGQTADGRITFSVADDLTKSLEFTAATDANGNAGGAMGFSGPAELPEQDVDGTGRAGFSGRLENLQLDVEFDKMTVDKNRAVISGTVRGATLEDYIGQRVLLSVEDNGQGIEDRSPDQFTWGVYKPVVMDWIPSDAEVRDDDGWHLTWWATDAERRDDVGIPSRPGTEITPQSFPLSSYSFAETTSGAGDIKVQP